MTSAIFAPLLAQSTFMAVWSSAGTSIVSRFIWAFGLNSAGCSRTSDTRSLFFLLYFMISDFTTFPDSCQGEFH